MNSKIMELCKKHVNKYVKQFFMFKQYFRSDSRKACIGRQCRHAGGQSNFR